MVQGLVILIVNGIGMDTIVLCGYRENFGNVIGGGKMMQCKCGGNIIKFNNYKPQRGDPFAQCDKCLMLYSWKEYRALQADKLIEIIGERGDN